MQAFAGLTDAIRADEYLHPHFRFYMREVRAVAYAQVSGWKHWSACACIGRVLRWAPCPHACYTCMPGVSVAARRCTPHASQHCTH